jgi:predicted N-formylglutamate amidohydrolase
LYDPPLIGPDDPPPFVILNPGGQARCLLVCDHAGIAVPRKLGSLGLDADDYGLHWTVDIGARDVTSALSALLNAPAIMANYSRIVVDLNRAPDHPTAFVESGEGKPIPGNLNLDDRDRACRIDEIYNPYHAALGQLVDGFVQGGIVPVILSIHSFTPVFFKEKRPWEVGVMWAQDSRIPLAMIDFFRGKGFVVGDNEPYSAKLLSGTTMHRHADGRRLPNALIEIRNDLLRTPKDCEIWAGLLHEFMNKILADDSIHTLYDGPAVQYDPDIAKRYFDDLNKKARQE